MKLWLNSQNRHRTRGSAPLTHCVGHWPTSFLLSLQTQGVHRTRLKDLPWSHTHTTNSYLECYTANRKVFPVLQHAQIFSDQCCWVDQALGSFSVIASFRVFSSHVLKPGQSQVWRGLVALGNSNQNRNASQAGWEFRELSSLPDKFLLWHKPATVSVSVAGNVTEYGKNHCDT